jgi:hypothetical protein
MSEDKSLESVELVHDLTEKELNDIVKFEAEGAPGIANLVPAQLAQAMDLYLSGKTYHFISRALGVKKIHLIYLSKKFGWFKAKQDYLADLQRTLKDRVIASKIESQDFLLQLSQMWQKKIGTKISRYLATGNEEFANKIDLKEVDRYLKTIDLLQQMSEDPKMAKKANAAVNLNAGDGVHVKKISDSEIEITPKQTHINNVLKQLADMRREADNKSREVKEIKEEIKEETSAQKIEANKGDLDDK